MKSMSEEGIRKRIYVSEVEETRKRGKPLRRWKDEVKDILRFGT